MGAGAMATPEEFVVTVVEVLPPQVQVGPAAGAVKVTVEQGRGFPPASHTVAASGLANAEPTAALWPLPPVTPMLAGGPTNIAW